MSTNSQDELSEATEPEAPSFEELKDRLSEIYAEGDLQQTYIRFTWYLKNMTIGDKPLTSDFLLMKFKQHIEEWNLMYGAKLGTQYFPTKAYALRKNFYDFMGEKFYEREFLTNVGQGERNKYLFGNFTTDYLKKQLERFRKGLPDETD
jgi:hypothetical protein